MKRIYGTLLRLYPARFREEFAAPMERHFWDEYRDAPTRGARIRFALHAFGDLAVSASAETLRELGQDLRYAARSYRRRSLVTALALTALALAIGATTGVFSVLNALLIRSLPFRAPDRLVELWASPVNIASGRAAFHAWRDESPYLADVAGFSTNEMNLTLARESARVRVSETTANFFQMLGTEPEFGRGFATNEDVKGQNAVAVIGYGLWQQMFGASPSALGATIRLNGVPFTVVGIAPRNVDYPGKTSIWTPTVYDLERIPKALAFGWNTIGRLKPGVTVNQASALLQAEVLRANGGRPRVREAGFSNDPRVVSLRDQLAGPVQSASFLLMGMVVLVLLIACANVAHLLLSQATERRTELAVRAALGASRARLVQQLVTEAVALTAVAAVVGMIVAHWTAKLADSASPAPLAARQYSVLDWQVIAFSLGLALVTGLVFGVLPASLIGRLQPGHDVIRIQQGSRGTGVSRMRALLSAMQAALTVTLVAASLSVGQGFLKLLGTDLAYSTEHVVTLNVSLSGTRYVTESRERQYYAEALDRLRGVPGVEVAAAVSHLPLISTMFSGGRFQLDSGQEGTLAVLNAATPGYFRAMGTDVIEGREFADSDREGGEPVVVISDDLARSFGGGPILGRKLKLGQPGKPGMSTIVGVIRAQRITGPAREATSQIFRPISQVPPGFITFVAKVHGEPGAFLSRCRDAVQGVDRDVPVYDVKSLGQSLDKNLARPKFYTSAIIFFAAFALLLAAIGTYGVASHSVAQRTHEIGIRIAVGGSPQRVRGMLFGQSMLPLVAGLLAGILGALWMGNLLRHLRINAEPTGLWMSALAALVLATAAAAAVWCATKRITRADPVASLRIE